LDAYVLAALRANGKGWQTRINETLHASLRVAGCVRNQSAGLKFVFTWLDGQG
jgi:hypothetical protein